MLLKLNFAFFSLLVGSMMANGLPSQMMDASISDMNSPIGNPAEIFMSLFKGLSKVVIENLSKQTESANTDDTDDEPIQKKFLSFSADSQANVSKQVEEKIQQLKSEVTNQVIEIPKVVAQKTEESAQKVKTEIENKVAEIINKTNLDTLPHKTPELIKQVISKLQTKEADAKALADANFTAVREKVNVVIKKSSIPEEIARPVEKLINKTSSVFVDACARLKEENLAEIDRKLKKLEKQIEKNLNMSVFEVEKFHNAKERFQGDFERLKENFTSSLEKFADGLKKYTEKISVEKRTVPKCADGGQEDCVYDLDESMSTADMDSKLVDLNKNIMANLNSSVFEHHKFHRSKSHFIHEYKKAKHVYLQKLSKISAEITDFVGKAKSKKTSDKATVKKEEDGFLYRNEQSLF